MREDYRTHDEAYLLQMIRERKPVRDLIEVAAEATDSQITLMMRLLIELVEERG